MKPRIFIGSSSESLQVANAIHAELDRDAECTVWSQGVVGLSTYTVQSLLGQAHGSDFAIFVVTPDDNATVRGKIFSIARDNVIYELGLFSGMLGPERCFFIAPRRSSIHLPSDLLGITAGDYESNRSDGNIRAAVAPFCTAVRSQIAKFGLFPRAIPEQLRDFAARFECCDWIANMNERVKTKRDIFKDMVSFCSSHALSKDTLLQTGGLGSAIALAAAIKVNPESGDDKRLLDLRARTVTRGVAQQIMVDTINELDDKSKINAAERSALVAWAESFQDQDPSLPPQIAALKAK